MKTARFWIYWRGDHIKLSLKIGDKIEMHDSGKTDEGFYAIVETYERSKYEPDVILSETTAWGRCCDGRYEHRSDYVCDLKDLQHKRETDEIHDLPPFPLWRKKTESCRDYTAESMNY